MNEIYAWKKVIKVEKVPVRATKSNEKIPVRPIMNR